MKLAILTSHVIQYQAPLFKKINRETDIDIAVYFNWNFGAKRTYDKQFGKEIEWDIPLLEGYRYAFLKNFSLKPSSNFWGQVNPGIIKELIKNRYDAILVYGWNSFTHWLVFAVAFLTGTKIFLHSENPLNQELQKSIIKLALKKFILGPLFKIADALLYIGEENRKFYKYYGVPDEKLFFMPYAVDNARFKRASDEMGDVRDELRKEMGIEKNDVAILFVGKFMLKKRPMDLLKAFELLTSHVSNFTTHLIFVGDGELRPDLEKYASDNNLKNIHFTGFVNQSELPKYYSLADIFVLPSQAGETWGLVTNEAMCFGLPVVVSDVVGCNADLVKQGENGYVFPCGNVEKLAGYLNALAESEEKRKNFGDKSFETIKAYSYENGVEGIIKAWNYIKNN